MEPPNSPSSRGHFLAPLASSWRRFCLLCTSPRLRAIAIPTGLALLILAITSVAWFRVLAERRHDINLHLRDNVYIGVEAFQEASSGSFGTLGVFELSYALAGDLQEQTFEKVAANSFEAADGSATQFAWVEPEGPTLTAPFRVVHLAGTPALDLAPGANLRTSPLLGPALRASRDAGQPVELYSELEPQLITVVRPVFLGPPPASTEQRREQLAGFAIGSFSLPRLLDLTQQTIDRHLQLELHPAGTSLTVTATATTDDGAIAEPHDQTAPGATMTLADRPWTVTGAPTASAASLHTRDTWSILGAGVFLALLVATFTRSQLSRTRDVEALVARRTAELEREVRTRTTIGRQLIRSQEMLAAAQAVAGVGSWQWDIATGDVTYSDEVYRLLARTPQDLGSHFGEVLPSVHPDDRELLIATLRRVRDGAVESGVDYRIVLPDQTIRWVHQAARLTLDEAGPAAFVIGTVHDITHRIEVERALARSNQRLEQAQRIAHVGHWEWDIVSNDLTWSDEIYRIFGLQPQEFEATYPAFLKRIHPDDRQAVEDAVGRAVAGDEEYAVDHRVVRPDGTVRTVHETGLITWSEDGQPLRMLGVVNDVTERVEAERAVAANNQYLRTVVDTVQAALIISDTDENIVMANQAAADMLGYTLEELSQIKPRAFVHPDDAEAIAARTRARAQGVESTPNFRRRMVRKDGSSVWVEATPSIFWLDGKIAGRVAEYREITHQIEAEEKLKEAANRLELAQSMAHIGSWGHSVVDGERYWSDELYRLLGYAPGAVASYPDLHLKHVHPDDRASYQAAVHDFNTEVVDEYDAIARFIGADDVERVLHMRGERIRDGEGNPLQTDGTAQDVSAKIAAERQLADAQHRAEESSDFLRTILNTIQTALLITDHDERIVQSNPAATEMLGYSSDELARIRPVELIHPDDLEATVNRWQDRLNGLPASDTFRMRLVRNDGSVIWVETTSAPMKGSNPAEQGRVAEYRDVTAEVEAEQQIRDTAARLKLAQSMARVGSWGRSLVDHDGYWSDEMFRILGYEPGSTQPSAGRMQKHLHPDDREAYDDTLRDFREERSDIYDAQARFIGADGVERVLRMHGERTRDERGNPIRLDGTGQDVTAQVAAEQQLATAQQRLSEELERAAEVQRAFQPGASARFQMLSVAGLCLPAREVGGDFFDWSPFDDGGVRVTIGDVMGKGIPAAIFMSMTQTAIRASGRPDPGSGSGPAGQLARVNRALYPYLDAADSFVTAFTAEVDRNGHFSYADAGHGHALIRRHDGSFTDLRSNGLPIGVSPDTTYVSSTAQLEPGDTLLLMTDGLRDVLDQFSTAGDWTEQLNSTVRNWNHPQQTAKEIVALARRHMPDDGFEDDLTLLVLGYDGAAATDPNVIPTGEFELIVQPTLKALASAESELQLFFRQLHVREEQSGAVLTAVHEILANIVEHARPSSDVALAVEVSEASILVTTHDNGRPFDANEAQRAAQAATDRGRGLAMCEVLLDRTNHIRTNGQNHWQLEMKLPPLSAVTTP